MIKRNIRFSSKLKGHEQWPPKQEYIYIYRERKRERERIKTFPHRTLTVSVHIGLETLGESACTALVPVGLVDGTAPFHGTLHLADVPSIAVYAPLEES